MPLTVNPPRTVVLTGRQTMDVIPGHPIIAVGAKPGMHVELFNNSGVLSWRPHSSATAMLPPYILLEQIANTGIEDAYPSGSEALVGVLRNGQEYYPTLPSGQDITMGDYLRSNGDGLLAEAADADATDNVAKAQALETLGVITVATRCRAIWNG